MIKTILFTCLVAAVSAEAEADAYYYNYGYPYAYAGVPFGSSTGLDPITQGLDPVTQGLLPYAGYGHGYYGHFLGKRSADADAEPEADAFYGVYGYPYAAYNGVPFGSSTGLDAITQGLDASTQGFLPYAGYGHGYYGHYLGKRSADAEPKADAYYSAYGYPYAAYAGVPFGSSTGLDPITQGLDASPQGFLPYGYAGYGHG